ncbi:MAG: hypothetical protein VB070_10545 [Clostridiaceae bacterium]|nr:hypothetical protein [Clostridiaceae bacterium]
MKKYLAICAIVMLVLVLSGSVVFAYQLYQEQDLASFSFSNTYTTIGVDGYPNSETTLDLSYKHRDTYCYISTARFYARPQAQGLFGYYDFGTNWNSPANTGSIIYGGSQNLTDQHGYFRYRLTAYNNYYTDGTRAVINSPASKFWITYYGYPQP